MKLISKRNNVTLRNALVHKQVKDPQAAALEASILRELRERSVAVPEVITCEGSLLVLEYLPGEPLPDVIEHGGYEPQAVAAALCDWFAAFYAAAPEQCRGDVNGRNFLYDGARVAGVDFEQRCHGPIACDAGKLAAFIETYDTCCKAKQAELSRAFMQLFAERLHCKMSEIIVQRERELEAMRHRRRDACDTIL